MMKKGIIAAVIACVALLATLIILFTVVLPVNDDQAHPTPITFTTQPQTKPADASSSPSGDDVVLDGDGFRVYPREMRYEQIKPPTVLPPAFTKWVRSTDFNGNDALPILDSWGDYRIEKPETAVSDAVYGLNAVYRDSQQRQIWFRVMPDPLTWDYLIEPLEEVRTVGPALCGKDPIDKGVECFVMTAEADIHISFDTAATENTYSDEEVAATFNAAIEAYRNQQ